MENTNITIAEYKAAKVQGRSDLDPRKGVYKILSIYNGTCFNKPAQIATVNWKNALNESYSNAIFHLQLETFKIGLNPLNTSVIVSREIQVISANWYPEAPLFAVGWSILPLINPSIDQVNELVGKNKFKIKFTEQDDLIENELNRYNDNLGDY